MVTAKHIKRAYEILDTYNGLNPYVSNIKRKYIHGNKVLNDFEVEYIINNYDFTPTEPNRTVNITNELGERLFEKYNLDFVPKKIRIEKIIGEMGDSMHAYIRYRQSVPSFLAFVSRKGILDSIEKVDWKNFEVDFTPYDEKTLKLPNPRRLKEHQKDGVRFLLANKKCILADSMGTGKTTTSLVAGLCTGAEKILVITTASLKTTWKREASLYLDESEINVVSGSKWDDCGRLTITNYDIVSNFYKVAEEPVFEKVPVFDAEGNIAEYVKKPVMVKNSAGKMVQKMKKSRNKDDIKEALAKSPLFLNKFDCVIIDEAQKLSNNKSIRYRTISDFLRKSKPEFIFLLTGTPLTNRPMNLYHILSLINAEVTKDYTYYTTRFCGARDLNKKDGTTVRVFGEPQNLEELREKIKDVYIRRVASDVGDMVEKRVETLYYDLTDEQTSKYEKLWDDYVRAQSGEKIEIGSEYDDMWDEYEAITEIEKYRQLVEGGLVRQYLANEMVEHTKELVDSFLEDGEKVVIITTFKKEMDALKKYYGNKCVTHRGGMTPKQKDKVQDEFINNPKIKVFIGNVVSASVGLNLQAAHLLVFNSFSWNNTDNRQAEDRIYRLTQDKDVVCYYQLFNDSISRDMFEKVLYKDTLANALIKSEKEKK